MKIYNPKTKKHATVTDSVGHRALKDGWVKADAELVAPEIVKPKKQPNAKLPKETKTEEVKEAADNVQKALNDVQSTFDEIEKFKQSIINNQENAD
jgi:hypothetical protein